MGLLDKIKSVFFEEEYVEVEEKEEPKEKVTVAKKIETPEIRKREENIEESKNSIVEETTVIEEKSKFPMSFDDKDFEVEKTIELEEPVKETTIEFKEVETTPIEADHDDEEPVIIESREKRYEELRYEEPKYEETRYEEHIEKEEPYHGLYEGKDNKEKQGFTPSPIISPIYGILNKNYKKEEIITRSEVRLSQATSKKTDLDIVREKAYGDLAGDISASIEDDITPKESEKEDLLYDLNEEESPVVKEVTVGDAEEYFNDLGLEYNVDYKVEKVEDNNKAEEENKIKIEESNEDDKNLFDLIDSMYEDKE